jgi:hypothetical protein
MGCGLTGSTAASLARGDRVLWVVVGKRDGATRFRFIRELRKRIVGRPQLSTDGFRPYIEAVERMCGADIDYAQVHKVYAAENPGPLGLIVHRA